MNKDQAKKSEKKTLFRRCSSQTKQFLKDIILNTDQKLLWILASKKKKKILTYQQGFTLCIGVLQNQRFDVS